MGWLHRSSSKTDTCVVIIHGHNSDGNRGRFITLAKWFEHHGMDACRWNAVRPKLGDDERYPVLMLTEETAQARALLEKLRPQYKRIVVVGHSQGGLIVLRLASEGLAEDLVQLMPVVDNKVNVEKKLASLGIDIEGMKTQGSASVTLQNGKTFIYNAEFFEDFLSHNAFDLYPLWKGPTMLVAGTHDTAIARDEVELGYSLANKPKELVIVDDVHNFSDETATMLAAKIVAWLRVVE